LKIFRYLKNLGFFEAIFQPWLASISTDARMNTRWRYHRFAYFCIK